MGSERTARQTGTLKERRRRALHLRAGAVAALVIALIGGAAYLARLPAVTVSDIEVVGEDAVKESAILETAREAMHGTWGLVIPKKNAFFYPAGDIEKNILTEHPRIKMAQVDARGLTALTIRVSERQPHALWCTSPEESCYFLDDQGLIFAQAPSFSGAPYFRYVAPLPGLDIAPEGQRLFPEEEFSRIENFIALLTREAGIVPRSLVLDERGDMHITLESGGTIIVKKDDDFSFVLENVKSVFASEELSGDARARLDYADFRFGTKVYFKFK
jgi:hypothetical protein